MVQFTWGGHIGSKSQIWLWNKNPFVCLLVRKTPQQLEIIIPHHLSFIIHPSSFFNHPSSFFINPSFISQLLSFSACFYTFGFWSHTVICLFGLRFMKWGATMILSKFASIFRKIIFIVRNATRSQSPYFSPIYWQHIMRRNGCFLSFSSHQDHLVCCSNLFICFLQTLPFASVIKIISFQRNIS